jgi:hypothetical protein
MTMAVVPEAATFRISPTDLVYLWDDCKRCFYDKVKNGLELPRGFSPHFTNADRAMRKALDTTEIIDLGVGPRFRVVSQGEWVESKPMLFQKEGIRLSLRGQCDAIVVTEDEEIFVVDYKTTTQDDAALLKFRRQLSCYVMALESPASERRPPVRVDGMAVIVFDPSRFGVRQDDKVGGLSGKTRWVELPRRDDRYHQFLNEIAATLGSSVPPVAVDTCSVCRLRFKP